ncbi:MAG: hypothetical protein ACK476_17385 [Fluviicola sp.]
MRIKDKTDLFHFITRKAMYIHPVDENNIVSFIHGYELGANGKCQFSELIKKHLIGKYKVNFSNDGWPGQISRLAKKQSLIWEMTFTRVTLEILSDESHGGFDEKMKRAFKKRVETLIDRINADGNIWFNENWTEEWLSLCSIKRNWFQKIWTENELQLLIAIDKLVQTDSVFENKTDFLPTTELLNLKEQFDQFKT